MSTSYCIDILRRNSVDFLVSNLVFFTCNFLKVTLYISAKKITGGDNVLHLKFSWSGKRISLILQKIKHKLKRQYSPFLLEGVQLLIAKQINLLL